MAGLGQPKTYQYLARPIEELINGHDAEQIDQPKGSAPEHVLGSGYSDCPPAERGVAACDVLIVGSGYGGSIAARVLAGTPDKARDRPIRVVMLERGREFVPDEFPESLGDLPGEVRYHRDDYDDDKNELKGDADALFDFRINKDVSALVANGLGGGSLINANVALRPDCATYKSAKWPKQLRDPDILEPHFKVVENLLGVETPEKNWLPTKYRAFQVLANSVNAIAKPAPLTVDLKSCTKCGNCITGCKVGAKKTLPLTVLSDATKNGLEIYTGASVLTVHRCSDDQGWTVRFRRTSTSKNLLKYEIFQIRARIVILAAGTLGSTEILLRSKCDERNPLPCSDKVGEGFSTNGGMIAFGYAGANPVRPIGKPSSQQHNDPGPTITGYACASFIGPSIILQDAAVPLGLKHIFEELVTTGSMVARYVNHRQPEWFKRNRKENPDPLVVHCEAIEHSQVILAIGRDQAKGCIELSKPKCPGDNHALPKNLDDTHALIKWDKAAKDPIFESIDFKLREAYAKRGLFLKDRDTTVEGGFDGGDYLPDPAWKAIPDEIAKCMEGGAPKGKILTVHPLGGCAMANWANNGVVNHLGQVFKGNDGDAVYNDLFVMDGAILPEALGINPFLTISALAHRNSCEIRKDIEACKFEFENTAVCNELGVLKAVTYGETERDPYDTKSLDDKPIRIEIYEQLACYPCSFPRIDDDQYRELICSANSDAEARHTKSNSSLKFVPPFKVDRYYRLVLRIKVMLELNKYLANPDKTPLTGDVTLSLDPNQWKGVNEYNLEIKEQDDNFSSHSLFIDPVEEDNLVEIARGDCRVKLLIREDAKHRDKLKRFCEVAFAARKKRGKDLSGRNFFLRVQELQLTASQHAHFRRLEYDLDFNGEGYLTKRLGQFKLSGKKDLAYTGENPWNALLRMEMELNTKVTSTPGRFYVDLNYLLKDGVPQVIESPHMPATLMGMARLGMFALRALVQTHLWSFAAPDYHKHECVKQILPEAITLKCGTKIVPQVCRLTHPKLDVPENESPKTYVKDLVPYITLARYASKETEEQKQKTHLLLIHGLAHGGAVFTTSTIDTPMATYFVEEGYVVWVLDHRLSPALEWQPHRRKVMMDHLGKTDIPLAVDHIYRISGRPIDVFAHCIGAGAFAIATLSGCLYDRENCRSKISRATIHAVTPWLIPSAKNRTNAKLAAFYKDALRFDDPSEAGFDPIPPAKNKKLEFSDVLIDRIAGSIPWPSNESHLGQRGHHEDHMSTSVCDRMTLWYSHQWNHSNLSKKTLDQIGTLVGFGNLEVFRHIYFCILRERLTDREGRNIYVTKDTIKKYWTFDTMFIHGLDNQVFTPAGSRISGWKLNKVTELLKKDSGTEKYRKPDIWRCDVHGYGHMDLLLGEDAWRHVYPQINAFFENKLSEAICLEPSALSQPVGTVSICKENSGGLVKYLPSTSAKTGPIFFNPEPIEGSEDIKVRVWLEPSEYSTGRPVGVNYIVDDGGQLRNASKVTSTDRAEIASFYGTYWIDTLTAGKGPILPSIIYEKDYPQGFIVVLAGRSNSVRLTKRMEPDQNLAFALGSCRYPGSPFEKDASDRVYAEICRQTDRKKTPNPLQLAMFVGDQIYADATANIFDTTEVVERYWERYRNAFGSPNFKELSKNNLPTYFALDDHEFDDGWLGGETIDSSVDTEMAERYKQARNAALNYQGMASYEKSKSDKGEYKFWYHFTSPDYPFFVMDTRTERKVRWAYTAPSDALITCPKRSEQWEKLKDWLLLANQKRGIPKFIACGSPLAPPLDETIRHRQSWRNDDSWLGFPGSLALLVEFIVDNAIKNVVLLGGDLHLSAYASMTFKAKGKTAQVHQIIASGLYAPLPFANTKERELGCGEYKIPGSEYMIEFGKARILTTSPSHFVRVDITCERGVHKINLQAYGNDRNDRNDGKLGNSITLTFD